MCFVCFMLFSMVGDATRWKGEPRCRDGFRLSDAMTCYASTFSHLDGSHCTFLCIRACIYMFSTQFFLCQLAAVFFFLISPHGDRRNVKISQSTEDRLGSCLNGMCVCVWVCNETNWRCVLSWEIEFRYFWSKRYLSQVWQKKCITNFSCVSLYFLFEMTKYWKLL